MSDATDICCPVVEIHAVEGPDRENDLTVSVAGRTLHISLECSPQNVLSALQPGKLVVLVPEHVRIKTAFEPYRCSYRYGGMSLVLPSTNGAHWIFDDGLPTPIIAKLAQDAAPLIGAIRED